jgi:predicted component of type VI protein secretion system
MMRLHILNRYSARLPSLMDVSEAGRGVTPFEMYLELRELLAELVALQPDRDNLFNVPAYSHENPYFGFAELDKNIRAFLQRSVKEKYIKVDFEYQNGMWRANLAEEHFKLPNGYFLGIKTKTEPKQLSKIIEDGWSFKVMPASMSASAVLGVPLKEERPPPAELPAQGDLFYYRLDVGSRRWPQVVSERAIILDWGKTGDSAVIAMAPDLKFALYMTVP